MTKALPRPPWHEQPRLLRRAFNDPSSVLDELSERLGPIFALGAGPGRLAVVGDPAALREMFSLSLDTFRWDYSPNVLRFVVGPKSMIVSDGDDHRRRRSSVKSAFSRRSLNGWIPAIVEQTDRAIDELLATHNTSRRPVDLYPFGRHLVLNIVVRTLFGERLATRVDELGALYQQAQDYLERPVLRQIAHPFPGTARARVRADRRALDALIDEQMTFLRQHRSDDPLDVLARLVANDDLTDDEIRDQVITLIGAGYDTTSAALAWMIWCVSLTPGLWTRLRHEADDVFGPLDGNDSSRESPVDEQTLSSLKLADAVMRETTRLHPAGVISPRQAATDLEIGGYRIPKGTLIMWSPHLAGRHPDAWDDPLRFDPDRFFSVTDAQAHIASAAWVPFGRGARNCLGFALAQMELTLIISRMAQRLDISTACQQAPRTVGMVVNRPEGGAPMNVSVRATAGARNTR